MTKGWIDSVKEKVFAPVELEDWKKNYIDWLDKNSVLKFGKFKLKSGRTSYSFANFGDVSDGISISSLGDYYAAAIDRNVEGEFKTIVGPAYKGISLAVTTAISLSRRRGKPVSFTYDRKEEKAYGEATNVSKAEAAKKMFLGYIPQNVPENKDRIVYIDDVITTGATKIEEDNKLKSVANVDVAGLFVALNRQEIDENGNDAVKELSTKLKTPVHAVANLLSEAVPYLAQKGRIDETIQRKHVAYTRAYGIEEVKPWCRDIRFIERDKGLIPACDVPLEKFEEIVRATQDIDGVVAYKVGFEALLGGLDKWVQTARKHTEKPIIYDHQKAMTDIPDTGRRFAEIMKTAGVDAIIGFPQSGPSTEMEWIHAAFDQDLEVLIGGEMTHPRYKASEGGNISDERLVDIYTLGAKMGVNNFVVPGNKVDRIEIYQAEIKKAVPKINPMFFSPGLITQGGNISEVTKRLGRFGGIAGRSIYGDIEKTGQYFTETQIREAAFDHVKQI